MWLVTGTSPSGAMSEVVADEQSALALMYAVGDDPRFDDYTFSCYPADEADRPVTVDGDVVTVRRWGRS